MDKKQKIVLYILLGIFVVTAGSLTVIRQRKRIAAETVVMVYFLDYDHEQHKSVLVPLRRDVERPMASREKIRWAVEQLLKGPSEAERQSGLTNAVAEDAVLRNVRIEGDTVYLDFSSEIEHGGGTAMMTERLVQIVFTATQFHPFNKVRLLIEGDYIDYFSGEGITDVEGPMGRDNFQYTVRQKGGGITR